MTFRWRIATTAAAIAAGFTIVFLVAGESLLSGALLGAGLGVGYVGLILRAAKAGWLSRDEKSASFDFSTLGCLLVGGLLVFLVAFLIAAALSSN